MPPISKRINQKNLNLNRKTFQSECKLEGDYYQQENDCKVISLLIIKMFK